MVSKEIITAWHKAVRPFLDAEDRPIEPVLPPNICKLFISDVLREKIRHGDNIDPDNFYAPELERKIINALEEDINGEFKVISFLAGTMKMTYEQRFDI